MPAFRGTGGSSSKLNDGAVALLRDHPGQVTIALPGQANMRPVPAERTTPLIVKIPVFDDVRTVYVDIAYALFQMGIEFNSMYASRPGEEIWFEPEDAAERCLDFGGSKVDAMFAFVALLRELEFALVDIQFKESGKKTGFDLIALLRMLFEDAFLASHSSFIQNLSEQLAFRAADTGLMKDTDVMIRAGYLYSRLFFGRSAARPNPRWLQDCSLCHYHVMACLEQDGKQQRVASKGECSRLEVRDHTIEFHPGTLCLPLGVGDAAAAYRTLQQRSTGTSPFDPRGLVKQHINNALKQIRSAGLAQTIREELEAHERERLAGPKISVVSSDGKQKYTFCPRDPLVAYPQTLIALTPSVLEGVGVQRLRPKGMVFPPKELYEQHRAITLEWNTSR